MALFLCAITSLRCFVMVRSGFASGYVVTPWICVICVICVICGQTAMDEN